jgi:hypothetical protein
MKPLIKAIAVGSLAAGITALLVSTCKESELGSTIGAFGREARFPLYFTVAGLNAAEGEIYRINSIESGKKVEPELIASGLNFPTGIAVDATGTIYFTEALPTPDGRVPPCYSR